MTYSKNALAIASLIGAILAWLGVEVDINTLTDAIVAAWTLGSVLVLIWNQVDRQNIHNFFFKK